MPNPWYDRIKQVLSDAHCLDERADGTSAIESLAYEIARQPDENAREQITAAILALVQEPSTSSFWSNLPLLIALSRYRTDGISQKLWVYLLKVPQEQTKKRAVLLDLLVEFGFVFQPRHINALGDIYYSSPISWLRAATTIRDRVWLTRLFNDTIPNLVDLGKLSGKDLAARLTYWTNSLSYLSDIVIDAAREYVSGRLSDQSAEPVLHWLQRNGYKVDEEIRQEHKMKGIDETDISRYFGIDFFTKSKQRVAC